MASATGIPEQHPTTVEAREDEPLLGGPGDVTQKEGVGIHHNLLIGAAPVVQAGIWILAALVWSGIFSHPLIFFSAHPSTLTLSKLLNSSAILLQVQAILALQPTATPRQKTIGTRVHFSLLAISNLAFITALIIIEINKGDHPRFTSVHGIMGLVTYILIALQASVGVIQYFFPSQVLGSVERGKKIYKYHRLFGYVLLVLELATVAAATQTTYNQTILGIQLWAVLVAAVLVILGVGARIKKHKLGF